VVKAIDQILGPQDDHLRCLLHEALLGVEADYRQAEIADAEAMADEPPVEGEVVR
jgi:hypothetical protein